MSGSTQNPRQRPPGNGSVTPNAIDLIFFTAATDRYDGGVGTAADLGGDVSTVGYQLVYKDPIDPTSTQEDFKTFVLYRKLVDPKPTFENNLGQTTLSGKVDFGASGASVVSAKENFICENVYEFTLTMNLRYTEAGSTKNLRIPIGQGSNAVTDLSIKGTGITRNDGTLIAGVKGASNSVVDGELIRSAQLTSVEISLTVLTDFGLKQLRARTFADATDKAEFIAKNSYQYSKMVQVPGS